MLDTDEDALICDLAETYNIYDYRSLTPLEVATFSIGLRENSRIKLKMTQNKVPLDTALLAMLNDRLAILQWSLSENARKGKNKPKLITELLFGKKENNIRHFESTEDYDSALKEFDMRNGD